MTNIPVNRVTISILHNSMEACIGEERIVSRQKGCHYILHTDNVGHIALVFNNLIEQQIIMGIGYEHWDEPPCPNEEPFMEQR